MGCKVETKAHVEGLDPENVPTDSGNSNRISELEKRVRILELLVDVEGKTGRPK